MIISRYSSWNLRPQVWWRRLPIYLRRRDTCPRRGIVYATFQRISQPTELPNGVYAPENLYSHFTLLRLHRAHAIELRTIFCGFFSSCPPLMTPPLPSSAPPVSGLGPPMEAMLARCCCIGEASWRYGWCWCWCWCSADENASACVRFGVDAREPPAEGSSGGAEGDSIAARECGEDFD